MKRYFLLASVTLALLFSVNGCSSTNDPTSITKVADQPESPPQELLAVSSTPADYAGLPKVNGSSKSIDGTGLQDSLPRRPPLPVQDDITALLDALPEGAEVGYLILDLERGVPIIEHGAGDHLIPASAAKLATAVAALDVLGPEHRYRTELRASGRLDQGVLQGDLILRGEGDPLLDVADLLGLVTKLANAGVRQINGRFLIDDSLLPRLTEIESSQPLDAAYNPGIGALSIAFNRVHLSWQGAAGLVVETVPRLEEARFESAASDALPPGGVQLKQQENGEVIWQLADRGGRRSKKSLPVKDAGLYVGRIFADLAALHGIDLPQPQRIFPLPPSSPLAVHESRPLRDLVRDMLWYSNNLMAELIGLSAARAIEPDLPSLQASADILFAHLKNLIPDVSWQDAKLSNHSGLSSAARLTPEQLAAILRYGWKEGMLPNLLPSSGWSGTLARRFNDPDQALRIWAKTGAINYATALAGYMLSAPYGPAVFAIMISDMDARASYDAQPRRTRKSENKADQWHAEARRAMDRLVGQWIEPALGS